ncbi:hypothetical protein DZC78_10030 [Olleya aquimaris]|nr:hypothetical protein DZC78_10030 [Olleya aquimaris]
MITKEKAIEIAKKYLKKKKRRFFKLDTEIEKVRYVENNDIGTDEKGNSIIKNTLTVCYEVESMDIILYCIIIDADTGEIIKTLGPHGSVEDRE